MVTISAPYLLDVVSSNTWETWQYSIPCQLPATSCRENRNKTNACGMAAI